MTIKVHTKEASFFLALPTVLVLNRMVASFTAKAVARALPDVHIDPQDLMPLIKAVRACKKQFGPLDIIDIVAANGDRVLIRL